MDTAARIVNGARSYTVRAQELDVILMAVVRRLLLDD